MKSGITWFYRIALLCCITLFGGYTFCSRMIQHSMVHVVLNQIHIEKKLAERLNSINFPKAEEESEKLTKILEDRSVSCLECIYRSVCCRHCQRYAK